MCATSTDMLRQQCLSLAKEVSSSKGSESQGIAVCMSDGWWACLKGGARTVMAARIMQVIKPASHLPYLRQAYCCDVSYAVRVKR